MIHKYILDLKNNGLLFLGHRNNMISIISCCSSQLHVSLYYNYKRTHKKEMRQAAVTPVT